MRLMPTHVTGPHLYQATPVAFLTQHGKETLLRSPLENALGCQLLHTDGYDTDLLGTFTDEIGRCGSQLEAARRKATIGMELLHTSVGIGSEGAFGPDPFSGLSAWDIEVVVWLDRSRQLEVVGMAQDFAMNQQRTVHTVEALMQFAQEAGFPAHHLLVHPGGAAPGQVRKGIRDTATLQAAFVEALAASPGQGVVVANDLRAFCNPTRQAVIGRAAADLVHKLQSPCPRCGSPGYCTTEHTPGLPCRVCGTPTRLPRMRILRCAACEHHEEQPVSPSHADPGHCPTCNP